jgi:hypothetical protein
MSYKDMILFGQTHKEFLRPYVSRLTILSGGYFDVGTGCIAYMFERLRQRYCRVTVRKTNLFGREKTQGVSPASQGQQRLVTVKALQTQWSGLKTPV